METQWRQFCTQNLFPYCFGKREQKHMGKLFTPQHCKSDLHQQKESRFLLQINMHLYPVITVHQDWRAAAAESQALHTHTTGNKHQEALRAGKRQRLISNNSISISISGI